MIIGICGGTGSGKTTVARRILENVSEEHVVYLPQDSYYRNLGDMPLTLRRNINFDHPDALDNELFANHLIALKAGEAIEMPIYDYTTHTRKAETKHVKATPIVIVEGILIFHDPRLRESMDVKIFVDTADDLRFLRRLQRDIHERGRTVEYEKMLGGCEIIGQLNRVAVHAKNFPDESPDTMALLPPYCWRKQ